MKLSVSKYFYSFFIFLHFRARFTVKGVAAADIWRAMCFTWSNVRRDMAVYVNGEKKDEKDRVRTGESITGGGLWVLGQDQDKLGGGFAINDAFQGQMTEVNVWGRVLTKQEISSFSMDCQRRMNGDVRSWPEFRTGLRGEVRILEEPTCKSKFAFPVQQYKL